MTEPVSFPIGGAQVSALQNRPNTNVAMPDADDIGQRFEQMLWAEMLTHAGLEKAFTQGGGEAASAFSRYVVEAVAKDIAANHPLGLADAVKQNAAPYAPPNVDKSL